MYLFSGQQWTDNNGYCGGHGDDGNSGSSIFFGDECGSPGISHSSIIFAFSAIKKKWQIDQWTNGLTGGQTLL